MIRLGLFACLCAFALIAGAKAAEPANDGTYVLVDQGADLANLWCNACHVIGGSGRPSGQDAAPPFPSLAPKVSENPDRYRSFLTNPHSPMREIALSREEIEALVAYITSLDDENK